jgi:hypothetical protein
MVVSSTGKHENSHTVDIPFFSLFRITNYQQISILEITQVINNVMSCKQVDNMFVGEYYVTYLHHMFRTLLLWELNGHTHK